MPEGVPKKRKWLRKESFLGLVCTKKHIRLQVLGAYWLVMLAVLMPKNQ